MTALLSKEKWTTAVVSLLVGLILVLWPKPLLAQNVGSHDQTGSVLAIENVTVEEGTVSGVIRNESPNAVRDVQLFIQYPFLWKNEFRPGKDNPSEGFYQTVSGDISRGGSLPFKFTPSSPLPKRSDGKFGEPSVSIAGYSEVIPQKR